MSTSYSQYLASAIRAAHEAGSIVSKAFSERHGFPAAGNASNDLGQGHSVAETWLVETKDNNSVDLVTILDKKVEGILIAYLAKEFPESR
jgi:hypothetical protein